MTTRDRWDQMRALIEAGQRGDADAERHALDELVERARFAFSVELRKTPAWRHAKNCDVADIRRAMHAAVNALCLAMLDAKSIAPQTDWDDTKQAQHDGSRQIYGGLGTPQRED